MTSANYTAPEGASPLIEQKPRSRRGLVHGVGVNDFPTSTYINGKDIKSYYIWHAMLQRCYSVSSQKKANIAYAGCSVVKEWHSFSAFEKWFTEHYVEGYQLDKDLLVAGNRVYGPDTCVFVSREINTLLLDNKASRGDYPLGVHFYKDRQKYGASVRVDGVPRYLGCFATQLEAHKAYQLAKADAIEAAKTDDPRIRKALDLRAAQLRDDHANSRITLKL